jgi:hypothetical protein
MRYMLSAVLIHVLWAFTWVCASLPLHERWLAWQQWRLSALDEVWVDKRQADVLEYLQPVNVWSVIGSVIVAVASFLAPILQACLQLM